MVVMDRLGAMTAFVSVAELRGFAPAARRLGLSASAVTRLVASLEQHLSVQLLRRTTRSVALTDAGSRYLERARRILADVAEAEGAARAERSEPIGRLVVSAPLVFGRQHVAPMMCDYLARHRAVVGELALADRLVHLIDEGIDVAVRIGRLDDSSLRVRQVGATRRVVVASPAYLAQRGRPRTPADLAAHATIELPPLTGTQQWRFVRDGKELSVPLAPSFVTNSADAAIGHAERGGGLAMVLSYQVAERVRAGALRIVLRRYEPPPLPIHVAYPSTRLPSASVRAFIDMAANRGWKFVDL